MQREAIDAIIRRAAELKAVIFQHTWFKTNGNYPGESTPDDLVTLARRFPEVPIICGHTGGTWELGIRAIRAQTNLYADLAGSDPTAGITEMAVRELGASRVIYGSDCGGRSFRQPAREGSRRSDQRCRQTEDLLRQPARPDAADLEGQGHAGVRPDVCRLKMLMTITCFAMPPGDLETADIHASA
jgi:hypothetical protein